MPEVLLFVEGENLMSFVSAVNYDPSQPLGGGFQKGRKTNSAALWEGIRATSAFSSCFLQSRIRFDLLFFEICRAAIGI
jgi:hypothetical protein